MHLAAEESELAASGVRAGLWRNSQFLMFLRTEDPTSKTQASANGQQRCCHKV